MYKEGKFARPTALVGSTSCVPSLTGRVAMLLVPELSRLLDPPLAALDPEHAARGKLAGC